MSFLNLFQPGSLRRHFSRSVFALCVLVCLSAALLLTGCPIDDDEFYDDGLLNPGLIGVWKFEYSFVDKDGILWEGYELYTITETHHFTFKGEFSSWGGKIMHVSNFSSTDGVIIIKYDPDNKQQWINWDTMEDITPVGRDYYGIYFRNLTANSVVLGNTSDQANNYGPSETATLEEAIQRFTLDNMSDWIDFSWANPLTRVVVEE